MSDSVLTFQREIPVRHEVDVFVAGGGPAGVAAAIAAARQGKSVFLAEGHSCFGGMGTAGLVPAFMRMGDGVNLLAAGVGSEVIDRLMDAGGSAEGRKDPGVASIGSISIHPEVLKRVYDEMVAEAGVNFSFHTAVVDVLTEGDRVAAAVCAAKSGLFAVKAKFYVDGTGDGDLAAWAGAPFEKGDETGDMMPGTLCSLWANVDWAAVRAGELGAGNKRVEEAFANGVFTHEDRHLPGMWRLPGTLGGGNIGHTFGVDGTDERSLTEALLWGRKLVLEYDRYYREYLKGFEGMELTTTGSLLGLRETRRIMGDYVLNIEDFKGRAVFDDEIGRYSYPVDIHVSGPNRAAYEKFLEEWQTYRYGEGESYGIPYRCLLPTGLSNVLVSGRCVSTDRYLQSSIRVMPGCYITGQACGVAAAVAIEADTDTRGVDVKVLQQRLKALGACLPNA